jgi:outer membrane protein TolC
MQVPVSASRVGTADRIEGISPQPGGDGRSEPETLKDAWRVALAVDKKLDATRWAVSSTERALLAAKAERWPVVDANASYTVRSAESAFQVERFSTVLPIAQDESFALHSQIRLPLFTSGRIRHGIDSAENEVEAAGHALAARVTDLKLQVADHYIAVLRAQRSVQVSKVAAESLSCHRRDVETLVQCERAPHLDLMAADVSLANARQVLIQAYNRLDLSRAGYNRSLGRPLTTRVSIAELPVVPVHRTVDQLTQLALRLRPELKQLAAEIRGLEHRARSRRASDLPQLDLVGQYDFTENRFAAPQGIAAVGVGVTWNVFDGGRDRHQAAALVSEAERLRSLLADLQSLVALEIRQRWLDTHETQKRLAVTSQALRRADENLRVTRQRYSSGLATNSRVLEAEALRSQAYGNHYNATYDAVFAVIRLRGATGELQH